MSLRTVGVEEELLLVDPATGQARAVAGAVMRGAGEEPPDTAAQEAPGVLERELQREQLETATRPCHSLDDLGRELRRCRQAAAQAAEAQGVRIAAMGTSPLTVEPSLTGASRYQQMAADFGLTVQEQLTCGCHIHVAVSSDEEGTAVLDRIQPWLPCLLALSANSPYWQGQDSQYASYRYQAWGRWPSAGPTQPFGSARAYHDTVQAMVGTGTILDQGMIYFDARLSRSYPTLEVRIADVCLLPDDAVLLAALVRGLAETEARSWQAGQPAHVIGPQLLRLASWRASRSGLDGELLDPLTSRPAKAGAVISGLIEHVRPALEEAGDYSRTQELAGAVLDRGNGAQAQRAVYQRSGQLSDVVRHVIDRTSGA
jgi:glutamate---cysteine ligase / carboxylate-amine ligase